MSYKTRSRFQYSALWGHLLYLVAGVGTSFLIYWIAGGFPPAPWVHLWNILSQMNSLWAANGVAVFFPTLILGLQLLLFVLVGGASLGFVVYEIIMILDVFSVWQHLAFLRRWFIRLRAVKLSSTKAGTPPGAPYLIPARAAAITALPASQPQPQMATLPPSAPDPVGEVSLPPLSQGILPTPKRDDLVSNTMSPALPESMRWVLRSPESLAQSEPETLPEQSLTGNGAERQRQLDVSEEKTLPYFDNQDARLTRDPNAPTPSKLQEVGRFDNPLANSFEKTQLPEGNPLANPFEEKTRETLPFPFPGRQQQPSFEDLLSGLLENHDDDDTLPSMFTGQLESESLEDPLANPFENADLPEDDPLANPFENVEQLPFEDPLANPFENAELPENDPLASPFEEDEALVEPSSTSKKTLPIEDPLANPFEEDTGDDETSPALRAIRQASLSAKAPQTALANPFEDAKEKPAGERGKSSNGGFQ